MRILFSLMTAAAVGCAAAASLDEKGFVRDWLVSGPWPSYRAEPLAKGLDTDFLDCEEDVRPYPGLKAEATFKADVAKLIAGIGSANEWGWKMTRKFDATWQVRTFDKGVISMDRAFGEVDDHFAFYAAAYVSVGKDVEAVVAVGSDDDHKVWLDRSELGRQATSQGVVPGNFRYAHRLTAGVHRLLVKVVDRTQGCGFCVQLLDGEGRPLEGVEILTDVRGRKTVLDRLLAADREVDKVQKDIVSAVERTTRVKAEMSALEQQADAAKARLAAAEKRLAAAYAKAEAAFAAEHAAAAAGGTKSTDVPLERATCRSRLCINGLWDVSKDRKRWEKHLVPIVVKESYYYTSTYPVEPVKKGGIYGPYKPSFGFEGYEAPILLQSPKLWFRTTYRWDGKAGRPTFFCDGILQHARFYSNGKACGEYFGNIGRVSVPLSDPVVGENTLEIEFDQEPSLSHHQNEGIRGDCYIDCLPDVRVKDIHVKTSWRKAMIGAKTEIENVGAEKAAVEVRQYATEGGRIRFAFPAVRRTVAPGATETVRSGGHWADPDLWGIGGDYGRPHLYELVTDVFMNGCRVDRHIQEFGFREFWVHHTDFFLNGKRIILQGDVGQPHGDLAKWRDVVWTIHRADGINILRLHDGEYWSERSASGADRVGMLLYVQMYPQLDVRRVRGKRPKDAPIIPPEEWVKKPEHAWNLANYERWFRMFRNHPSVVIWSTDNEILTQAWDTAEKAPLNVRNDKVGALYEKYMESLDSSLVLTRDGDIGTWNRKQRWFEDPPCDTANYHYPDFNVADYVKNWQKVYEWRPAVFGETLYYSYGAWDNWIGPEPGQVAKKAARVREIAALYRRLGVPGQIYMGPSLDGYVERKADGSGSPWGRLDSRVKWLRIPWPATSGRGPRTFATKVGNPMNGNAAMNWFEASLPSHVRNAVSDAYRETLIPQPALETGCDAEVIVDTAANGEVWSVSAATGERYGVRADAEGRAWFDFTFPGKYRFEAGGATVAATLGDRRAYAREPGFGKVPHLTVK